VQYFFSGDDLKLQLEYTAFSEQGPSTTTIGSSYRCRRDGDTEGVEDGGGSWRLVESAPLLVAAISSTVLHRPPPTSRTQSPVVLLATTTSTRDAGLLDSLLPVFERQTRYTVKVIAVGSGQALAMGRRGDADVVLSHAPDAERALVDRATSCAAGW